MASITQLSAKLSCIQLHEHPPTTIRRELLNRLCLDSLSAFAGLEPGTNRIVTAYVIDELNVFIQKIIENIPESAPTRDQVKSLVTEVCSSQKFAGFKTLKEALIHIQPSIRSLSKLTNPAPNCRSRILS